MASIADASASEEESVRTQLTALLHEIGWIDRSLDEVAERDRDVIARLAPVGRAVFEAVHGQAQDEQGVERVLGEFENWYRGERGREFLTVFDRYVPNGPVVDF